MLHTKLVRSPVAHPSATCSVQRWRIRLLHTKLVRSAVAHPSATYKTGPFSGGASVRYIQNWSAQRWRIRPLHTKLFPSAVLHPCAVMYCSSRHQMVPRVETTATDSRVKDSPPPTFKLTYPSELLLQCQAAQNLVTQAIATFSASVSVLGLKQTSTK